MIKVNSSSYLWRQWKTMVYNFLSTVYIMVYNCQTFKECSNSSHPWRHSVDKWISLYSLWISWYIISIHGVHHGMHLSDFFKECSNSSSHLWRQSVDRCVPLYYRCIHFGYRGVYNFQSTAYIMVFTSQTFSRNVIIHHHISGDNGNIISIHGYRDDHSEIIISLETMEDRCISLYSLWISWCV